MGLLTPFPLSEALPHFLFFFSHRKKLVKPFLSISSLRELFSTGFYKSCLATFMEVMTHARAVRAVGIFTYTDFIVMLDGCPLL